MEPADVQRIVGERYRVVRKIGEGGLGVVVEAVDTRLERPVAIKILAGDLGGVARGQFVREAQSMARVRGDHVLTVYDCILGDGDVPCLVMELAEGSLWSWLQPGLPLDPRVATEIVRQVAEGLRTLHASGVVHRDIKPGNILIDTTRARVLLGDFGVALIAAHEEFARSGHLIGTPLYISPEAVLGEAMDGRSDLYSLGVVFYELLTGTLPFTGATIAKVIAARIRERPPSPRSIRPDVPAALDRLVLKLLDPNPDQRFQSAAELVGLLERVEFREGEPEGTRGLEPVALRRWLVDARPAPGAQSRELADAYATTLAPGPEVAETVTTEAVAVESKPERSDHSSAAIHLRDTMTGPMSSPHIPYIEDADEQGPPAWLMVTTTGGEETQYRLRETIVVGRIPSCDVMLSDSRASRRHFTIYARDGSFYLEDVGSANGTFVNDEQVYEAVELHDRDRIWVGSTEMVFIRPAVTEREGAAQRRLRLLGELWDDRLATDAAGQPPDVSRFAHELTHGLLREALGYRVEHEVARYRGIVGYMVEAPMLWIRQTRFPILYVPFTESLALDDITAQLQAARAADFLALMVVVPPHEASGREAAAVRRLVSDSVYRYDLAVLDRDDLARIIAAGDSRTLVELFVDQGIERSRLSPYVIRGPVPENMFFGRETEIKELSQNLGNHAVVGGRRMGKSSMFLRLRRVLGSDPRFCAFYVNCEACFDYDDFLATFSASVTPDAPIAGVAGLRAGLTAVAGEHRGEQPIYLLDEVDELVSFDAGNRAPGRLFKTLRALSHEGIGRFVFSGGRSLYDALHDAHSPFFNFCDDMRLYPLSRRSVAEIVVKPTRQLAIGLADEDAIIDRIFAITSGHPNLVQYLCHRLVNRGTHREITLAMVDEVVTDEEFVQHFLETAWSQSTPLEKLITLLSTEVEFSRGWLLERLAEHGVTEHRVIDSALRTLELYAVIRADGDALRFVLEYFPTTAARIDVASHVAAQLAEIEEDGCSSSTAR